MHTITLRYGDGSGWLFTRKDGSPLWEGDALRNGEPEGYPGIVANDHRKRAIELSLHGPFDVTIISTHTS